MIHPILFAVLLITVVPASAQIYSWKDKDGRTHFGDTPPTSGEVTEIRAPQTRAAQPPAPATGATGNDTLESTRSRSLAERERAFRERRASAAEAEAAAAQEVARKQELEQWCTAAANELAALRAGQRDGPLQRSRRARISRRQHARGRNPAPRPADKRTLQVRPCTVAIAASGTPIRRPRPVRPPFS